MANSTLDTGDNPDVVCPGPNCPMSGLQVHVRSSSPLWLWMDWFRKEDGKLVYAVYTQTEGWTRAKEVPVAEDVDASRKKLHEGLELGGAALWANPQMAAAQIDRGILGDA